MSKKMLLSVAVLAVIAAALFFTSIPDEPESEAMTAEQYRAVAEEVRNAYPRLQAGELEPGQIKALKQDCEILLAYNEAHADDAEGFMPAPMVPCEEILAAPLSNS